MLQFMKVTVIQYVNFGLHNLWRWAQTQAIDDLQGQTRWKNECEFAHFCDDCFFGAQEKAWMEDRLVLFFIKKL